MKPIAHAIEAGIKQNLSAKEIYESLAFEDIRRACDILRPVYDESGGMDGYVSIEVSPHLARGHCRHHAGKPVASFKAVDRDNVMIKIPGTMAGLGAIEQAICEGINVNVTLLFSVEMYRQAALAYIRGLEKRLEQGQPIDTIGSVASFFLSRIDTKVDDRLQERMKRIGSDTLNEEKRFGKREG